MTTTTTDNRVYILDIHNDEIEVDMDLREPNRNMVGVYLEGPMTGHEFVLTREMIQDADEAYKEALLKEKEYT